MKPSEKVLIESAEKPRQRGETKYAYMKRRRLAAARKAGRAPRGTNPKQDTKDIRVFFQNFMEGNLDNMQRWLVVTGRRKPAVALNAMLKMAEFCIPKLQRVEQVGLSPDAAAHVAAAEQALAAAQDQANAAMIYKQMMTGGELHPAEEKPAPGKRAN